jgi:hemolysin activation/secretion protein
MNLKLILLGTSLLCLSWNGATLAQQVSESSNEVTTLTPNPSPSKGKGDKSSSQLMLVVLFHHSDERELGDKTGLMDCPEARPELKFQANSSSPLKWTKKRPISCSRFQPTLAMSQEIIAVPIRVEYRDCRGTALPCPYPNPQTIENFYNSLAGDEVPGMESLPITPSNDSLQLAQTPPTIPPGIIEPTRPGLPPLPSTPPPTPTPSPLIPPPETPQTPPTQLGVTVRVQRIEVLGSTVFSPEQLQAAVASFIGKDATFEELLAIRTAITNLYTDKGYTTSGAFLPPQDLTDGVVRIQVVEGAIEKVEIQGLQRLRSSYVRSRINLATQIPVNLRRLEDALQLLQLNSLISTVQAELSAGTAPGLSVLTLRVKEAQPYTAALIVENRDSPSVGEVRGTVAIAHNNLLGFGDRFNFDYGITKGVNSYNLGYEFPLNPRDGTLSVSYGNTSSRIIEQPFSEFDINADSYTFSLGFRQPIIKTPTTEFALSLSTDLRQSQTFLLEDIPFSFSQGPENGKSRVTVLRFSQDWINRSTTRVLAARSQFSFGLDAFGATVNDTGTDGRFTSWLGQFQWVQALGGNTILITRAAAQLSFDSLLPIEQLSVGGIDTVRGYRQNQRVADNGIVGSVELRYPIIRQPDGIGTLQLAPFFDIGTVWNQEGEIASPSTLASIGLGLRWQLDPYLSARLDWGIPLLSIGDRGDSLQDNGISFSIRYQPF